MQQRCGTKPGAEAARCNCEQKRGFFGLSATLALCNMRSCRLFAARPSSSSQSTKTGDLPVWLRLDAVRRRSIARVFCRAPKFNRTSRKKKSGTPCPLEKHAASSPGLSCGSNPLVGASSPWAAPIPHDKQRTPKATWGVPTGSCRRAERKSPDLTNTSHHHPYRICASRQQSAEKLARPGDRTNSNFALQRACCIYHWIGWPVFAVDPCFEARNRRPIRHRHAHQTTPS